MTLTLQSSCELHPQVALRPETCGALAYHYGNRKLIFLKHPDVVAVVKSMSEHETLEIALQANAVDPSRWPGFISALDSLAKSEIIRVR
jgi:hypothetical protein